MQIIRKLNQQQVTNILTFVLVLTLAFLPVVGFAQGDIFGNQPTISDDRLAQPGDANVIQLIIDIIKIALSVVGLIAVVFLIFGGFKYMTAGGDEEKVAGAKQTIINALIGLVVVILSYAVVALVASFAQNPNSAI